MEGRVLCDPTHVRNQRRLTEADSGKRGQELGWGMGDSGQGAQGLVTQDEQDWTLL